MVPSWSWMQLRCERVWNYVYMWGEVERVNVIATAPLPIGLSLIYICNISATSQSYICVAVLTSLSNFHTCVKGVCIQTHAVLRQAWEEKVRTGQMAQWGQMMEGHGED